jgi:predicted Zn-dependent protease with MMP-like domain
MGMTETMAPDLSTIEQLARAAMAGLPALFQDHLESVVLRVEPFPDAEVIAAMGLDSEWDLLGLYWGRPVGEKGAAPTGAMPDMIFLYGQPLLAEWCVGEDSLEALVTHVLVHEVGHHFGLSDADMEAIEASCR